MAEDTQLAQQRYVPSKQLNTEYPLIDSDPHFRRVIKYARPTDWSKAAGIAAFGPSLLLIWERFTPSLVGKGGFPSVLRLNGVLGLGGAFFWLYSTSCNRFYGAIENKREVEMDMREMVDKVKSGEPLYGKSTLTTYMQGVASRNSRYSGLFLHIMPWFNVVNHEQHGVDTAKYYRQAERELAAESEAKGAKI